MTDPRARVIRRRVMGTRTERMEAPAPARTLGSGASRIAGGFGVVLIVGFLLLLLPFASEESGSAGPHVALFTTVSAVTVTGLVLVDTGDYWTGFGETVILVLIQVGGLGYMSGTTIILWALGRRLGLRDRHLLRLYYGVPTAGETFAFVRGIAIFTFAFEAVGALLLFGFFLVDGHPAGHSAWWAVFHAVSAFNNAGFNITGADMMPYAENSALLFVLTVLIFAGSVGYLPILTLYRVHTFKGLPLDHKLIFATTGALLVAGAVFFTVVEWNNENTLGDIPRGERTMVGVFQSMSARTAGFSAIDLGDAEDETKLALVALMFVGGAAGSTAGGLKVGAFALLLAAMISTVRGRSEITAFRRRIPDTAIHQATTLALTFVALLFAFTMGLAAASDEPLVDVLLEAVSALSTVGYSSIGSPNFSRTAETILIAAMLVGRFAPLMLVLYMTRPRHRINYHYPEDSVRLG